ncbi:MAG: hypothetical protein SFW67_28420 [Myxococcaceae bacterium]|nr:hypothetical protein [Myxococcaceae bacterium]
MAALLDRCDELGFGKILPGVVRHFSGLERRPVSVCTCKDGAFQHSMMGNGFAHDLACEVQALILAVGTEDDFAAIRNAAHELVLFCAIETRHWAWVTGRTPDQPLPRPPGL